MSKSIKVQLKDVYQDDVTMDVELVIEDNAIWIKSPLHNDSYGNNCIASIESNDGELVMRHWSNKEEDEADVTTSFKNARITRKEENKKNFLKEMDNKENV